MSPPGRSRAQPICRGELAGNEPGSMNTRRQKVIRHVFLLKCRIESLNYLAGLKYYGLCIVIIVTGV